jgi:hypothetical protein
VWGEQEMFKEGSIITPVLQIWMVLKGADADPKMSIGLNPDFNHKFTKDPITPEAAAMFGGFNESSYAFAAVLKELSE